MVTTDFRSILASVCERHLRLPDAKLAEVFPMVPTGTPQRHPGLKVGSYSADMDQLDSPADGNDGGDIAPASSILATFGPG
jgi:hypothetical protein